MPLTRVMRMALPGQERIRKYVALTSQHIARIIIIPVRENLVAAQRLHIQVADQPPAYIPVVASHLQHRTHCALCWHWWLR